MILITAANGNQGKWLMPKLVSTGHKVRACVQSQASAAQLRSLGAEDVVVGNLVDPDFIARSMQGVQSVYHIGPTLHPAERIIGINMINAASAAGVQHFVFSSVLHAITTDLIQHQIKRDLEEHLLSSGLEFTILQPSNYMLPHRLKPVFEEGVFRLSWSLERRQSMVALKDVAEVALEILSFPERHGAATYELVGSGRFTGHDIGQTLSKLLGREIKVEEIASSTFVASMFKDQDPGTAAYKAKAAGAISARYSSHDFLGNPNVLTWLLGRSPTTFEEFARQEYAAFKSLNATSI